ncbi:related to Transcription factor SKN7 [Zygosaccharomyces bailii ISA1307]|uniref:Transcription factor n=1 Tax=Zygosaccharomyces bailii (strain CLIB 213 / ATCC 58445 / CBS 680 / BCRC 21525 / NBRC 1098 / NCYC 1416 / NRRL Y-2227) TaxID=1333698 RepID=A0A8J2XAJ3_ZYGB2|nr:ZYBA0S13-00672g1_1 [Zygosaccharomyces bailii CLIB 213]CDH16773.1 related to Transcription factor SKN7 [Zygosaccharomyces bailii ISA1307]
MNFSNDADMSRPSTATSTSIAASSLKAPSNDFVRKLFGILERCEYPDIVRWTEKGESFVVLDTGKFTTQILPNHFKHSNFASFVRQLNKYDFHKVKKSPEERQNSQYGELSWEFRHPYFTIHNEEALDNIKRKTTVQKKIMLDDSTVLLKPNSGSQPGMEEKSGANLILGNAVTKDKFNLLKRRVDRLQKDLDSAKEESYNSKLEFQKLNSKYNTVVESLFTFKTVNDNLMNNFNVLCSSLSNRGIDLPPHIYDDSNLKQSSTTAPTQATSMSPLKTKGFDLNNAVNAMVPGPMPLTVSLSTNNSAAPATDLQLPLSSVSHGPGATGTDKGGDKLNETYDSFVLKEGFHVLLVEDDAVCIQLCSKFLRKYGCTVEVVTDGLSAISTLEKFRYDLVLMDIVMPNLDGATATSIVRSFDNHTPIIAMTGNIQDQDLITYLQHGMNDILAKPFTKDDLHSMLIRYLRDRIPLIKQREQQSSGAAHGEPQGTGKSGQVPPDSSSRKDLLTRSHSHSQLQNSIDDATAAQQPSSGPSTQGSGRGPLSENASRHSSAVISEHEVKGLVDDEPLLKKQRV